MSRMLNCNPHLIPIHPSIMSPSLLSLSTSLIIFCVLVTWTKSANFESRPPYFTQKYSNVPAPRGLLVDEVGDILVVSRLNSSVIALWETVIDTEGSVWVNQSTIIEGTGLGLNHGITYKDQYLYASSSATVYRWPYQPGQRSLVEVDPEIVVRNIPVGGHSTRTILFDAEGRLYVQMGSLATAGDFDLDSSRARIHRFESFTNVPDGGFDFFEDGEVFADGVRNQVALDFDLERILWGLDNGIGNLNRTDLGEVDVIIPNNPSEEMNKFDSVPGTHYGYPYCFSSFQIEGYSPGTQFSYPAFMTDGLHTDEWCQDPANNKPPEFNLQAHLAPLGLQFYRGQSCEVANGAFPCSAIGDAFVANHGSSDKSVGAGYNVQWYEINKATGTPTGFVTNIVYAPNITSCDGLCFRPVSAIFSRQGYLIVASDNSNEIFRVSYASVLPPVYFE